MPENKFIPISIACLTISDTRNHENDMSGKFLATHISEAGHVLADSRIVKDNVYAIRAAVSQWIVDADVQVVITTGGTGFVDTDVTPEALEVLFDKRIDGFGELFRHVSYTEIGTSTMQSRVCAGMANNTIIFALPGSTKACRTGWGLISEQLDRRKKSCSFVNVLFNGSLFGDEATTWDGFLEYRESKQVSGKTEAAAWMISVEQAKKILEDTRHSRSPSVGSERVPLEDAHNRILAESIHAPQDSPAFDNSAMDGFVFHTEDITQHQKLGKPIPVCGEIASGEIPLEFIRSHTFKIFTGAPVPYGANCVVPIEQCVVTEAGVSLNQEKNIREGQHIRPRGLSFAKGECVLEKGTRIHGMNTAVLASIGISSVEVFRKIKIAIGVTGNELVIPGDASLQMGKIYDSNSVLLCQFCREHGFEIVAAENIPDTLGNTRTFLSQAAGKADVILTTGGISMGDKDFVKLILKELSHTDKCVVHFQGVALKPGKPFTFAGIEENIPLFCMPGNPLSVCITFLYFVLPYLYGMAGREDYSAVLEKVLSPDAFLPYPRTRFLFGIRESTGINAGITVPGEQSSASVKNLIRADGALIIPADTAVEKNEQVDFFPFH